MRRLIVFPVLLFVILAISGSATAGISLGSGAITLSAGQSTEMCDVWIYASQEGGTYHIETTGDLKPLTGDISPNDFTLEAIDCPEEKEERRACIATTCLSGDGSSCKIVCLKFTAPLLFGWGGEEKIEYTGSILNSIKIGAATIKEPYEFTVYVKPINVIPVATGAGVVILLLIAAVFVMRRRKK